MAKDVTFAVETPVSENLALRWWKFLIQAAEKREHVTTAGTIRKIKQEEAS